MADNFSTPVTDGTALATKDIGGVHFPKNLIADVNGVDAIGEVQATPTPNTMLARLKAIVDALGTSNSALAALASILTSVDGIEGLIGTSNSALIAIGNSVDGLEALLGAATPAGENYIGKQGGDVLMVSASPTVSTTAYAAGDVIGAKMTFTSAARVAAGSGIIQSVVLNCKSLQTGAVDLLLFDADPSASTFTDNGAFAVAAADFDKLIGAVHITDWTSLGASGPSLAQYLNVCIPFKLAAGTSIYAVLVARSTPTLGSTTDITVNLNIIPG